MVYRKSAKMPLIFHVNGLGQNEKQVTPSLAFTTSSSLYIKRFAMFQNLQNTKPCGTCGGR